MSSLYPTSLDTNSTVPANTAPTQVLNALGVIGLSPAYNNAAEAILALETKLGTGAATPATSRFLVGTGSGTSDWSKVVPAGTVVGTTDTQNLTNKTVTDTLNVAGAITQAGSADHITLTPGTSKLVKSSYLKQEITTNTYVNGVVTLAGWGYMQGDAANKLVTTSVTFGVTFTSRPTIVVGLIGRKDTSAPTHIGDFGDTGALSDGNGIWTYGSATSTTGFTANMRIGAAAAGWTSSIYLGFSWVAIGPI